MTEQEASDLFLGRDRKTVLLERITTALNNGKYYQFKGAFQTSTAPGYSGVVLFLRDK